MANSRSESTAREHAPRVLIAVSGSIAAYKAADLVSLLKKSDCEVQCLLTASAAEFVSHLVLETLSGNSVQRELFGPGISGTEHIRLARWAEVIVFAPATANLIAKLALGLADDLVTTVALATKAPWVISPAMNTVMWEKPVIRSHVETLRRSGVRFVNPAEGILACGEEGAGKLAAVEDIAQAVTATLRDRAKLRIPEIPQDLTGQTILITAGPTTSAIDAVRYLTNPSTGKMGAAMAEEALRRGARVEYILGVDKGVVRPAAPAGSAERLRVHEVITAEEMADRALAALPTCTGVIASAAVLDYRVEQSSREKQKRSTEPAVLKLVPSVDVLASLRNAARPGQWFFGFAAESDRIEDSARDKFERKKLDYLFANQIARLGEKTRTGFGSDENAGIFLSRGRPNEAIRLTSKTDLARQLWDRVVCDFHDHRRPEISP